MTFSSSFGRVFSPTFQPKSQAKKGGIVVYDTFTDTDGTLLSDHTPEIYPAGSSWGGGAATTGTTINNNAANSTAAYNTASGCGIDTGLVNCKITANVSGNATDVNDTNYIFKRQGIKVRCSTAANGLCNDTATWYGILIAPSLDTFVIVQKNSGNSYVIRASTSVVINPSTYYLIVVTVSGSTITATLDGANEISYTSATVNQTSTIHGIIPNGLGFSSYVDNFKVESI